MTDDEIMTHLTDKAVELATLPEVDTATGHHRTPLWRVEAAIYEALAATAPELARKWRPSPIDPEVAATALAEAWPSGATTQAEAVRAALRGLAGTLGIRADFEIAQGRVAAKRTGAVLR